MINHILLHIRRHPGHFLAFTITLTACYFLMTINYVFVREVICLRGLQTGKCVPNSTSHSWTSSSSEQREEVPLNKRKLVLLWSPLYIGIEFMVKGSKSFDHPSCSEKLCEITSDRSRLMESDAVVFHLRSLSMFDIPIRRISHQKWILFTLESPAYSHFHGLAFMREMFNWTMTYRRDSDIFTPYGYVLQTNTSASNTKDLHSLWKSKSKMAVWMVSHCNTDGQREKYVKELAKDMDVVIYGECGDAVCPLNRTNDCLKNFSKDFYFYLAFENSICKDYVTEKFYRTLNHDVIPVVFGGGNYSIIAPEGSYINALDFPSPKELANYLHKVASNFSLYAEYFKWKKGIYVDDLPNACALCEKLHSKSFLVNSAYHDIQKWWINQPPCSKWISS